MPKRESVSNYWLKNPTKSQTNTLNTLHGGFPGDILVTKNDDLLWANPSKGLVTISKSGEVKLLFSPEKPFPLSDGETLSTAKHLAYVPSINVVFMSNGNQLYQFNPDDLQGSIVTLLSRNSPDAKCGATMAVGKSNSQSELYKDLNVSLSRLCRGDEITELTVMDQCSKDAATVKVAYSQLHQDTYSNIVSFEMPCPK